MSEAAVGNSQLRAATGVPTGQARPPWMLVCDSCGTRHAATATLWQCPCGGPLNLEWPVPAKVPASGHASGIWRYRGAFPPLADGSMVTLGEGQTPIVAARDVPGVAYKLDFLFPTGSFKDRGTAVLVSCLRELGIAQAVEDSSGNAGASMAAYFAASGIEGRIFVPAATAPGKVTQIRSFGAHLIPVEGTRSDVTRAAQEAAPGAYYASHLWSPYFLAGTMSFAFELWEQHGGRVPDRVVIPVGGGTLLLGAHLGFQCLLRSGMSQSMPALIGVQAEGFAPLQHAFVQGREDVAGYTTSEEETVAEGIRLRHPPRARQILRAVRETGGSIEAVSEDAIRRAWGRLAGQGLYVEPTGAVAAAALDRLTFEEGEDRLPTTIVALTGSGLKGVAGMVNGGTGVPSGKE